MEILIGGLVLWAIFSGLGCWIATQKHRPPEEGLVLGLLFGPFGCLIEAVLPTLQPKAPNPSEPPGPPPKQTAQAREGGFVRLVKVESPEERYRRDQRAAQQREREFIAKERAREERREWVNRMVWRFGWFRALPETLQPILIGLAVAVPVVVALVMLFGRS